MLTYNTHEQNGATVLRFDGELGALTVPEVRPEVDRIVARGPGKVVVDLAQVKTIDSSGVAIIVSLFKRMREQGGAVRVAAVDGQPREIFQFLKLDRALPVFGTVDEALRDF